MWPVSATSREYNFVGPDCMCNSGVGGLWLTRARRRSSFQRCSWAGSSSGIHRFRRREYLLHKCGDVLHGGRKMKSRSLSIQGDRIVFWWKVPWPHSLHLKMSVRRLPVNAQEPDAALLICCEHELRDFVRNHVRFDQCCAWCFQQRNTSHLLCVPTA